MDSIPKDILSIIFSYLGINALLCSIRVSKLWKSLIQDSSHYNMLHRIEYIKKRPKDWPTWLPKGDRYVEALRWLHLAPKKMPSYHQVAKSIVKDLKQFLPCSVRFLSLGYDHPRVMMEKVFISKQRRTQGKVYDQQL
jgi:hypothetical protein